MKENIIDAYVHGIGTVRDCVDCGALIAGGPVRCVRCAKEGPPGAWFGPQRVTLAKWRAKIRWSRFGRLAHRLWTARPGSCKTCEKLRVQLAGCSVAALGGTKNPAIKGDYGWSPSYQDVLDLRKRCEATEDLLVICERADEPTVEFEGAVNAIEGSESDHGPQ